jgi:hypothetical protein
MGLAWLVLHFGRAWLLALLGLAGFGLAFGLFLAWLLAFLGLSFTFPLVLVSFGIAFGLALVLA